MPEPPPTPPLSPLDVLLTAMRRKWQDGDLDAAAALARAAAPYLHPRHAALRLDQPPSPKGSTRPAPPAATHLLTDAQLDLLLDTTGDESGDETGDETGEAGPGGDKGGAGPP
jgi:hypothetical protein